MFSPIERMIALRYLRSRRREGLISVIAAFSLIGIALGVATLIVVMAVMNGFREEITGKILGASGHITVLPYEKNIGSFDALAQKLVSVEGVKDVMPVVSGQVMAVGERQNSGAFVTGIRLKDLQAKSLISGHITSGDLEGYNDGPHVVMGAQLAMNLGLKVGDKVALVSPSSHSTAMGMIPRIKHYRLKAIFNAGMYEYDNSMVFMPLQAAQLFFRYPETVSALEIVTTDPDQVREISGRIYDQLGENQYFIQDWQMANSSLFSALKVERTVMFLILTLIVIIAAFNIVASLMMLVNDKAQDIAILRTMGASKGMMMRVFFMCGAAVGVIGTVGGVTLGVLFAKNIESIRRFIESLTGSKLFDPVIYFLAELPASIHAADVVKAMIVGLLFSFLATLYPVWKVSRRDPAEVLRYE